MNSITNIIENLKNNPAISHIAACDSNNIYTYGNNSLQDCGEISNLLITIAFLLYSRHDPKIMKEKIDEYVPLFSKNVNVSHILAMTSGLDNYFDFDAFHSMNDIIYYLSQRDKISNPGQSFKHSCILHGLLCSVFKHFTHIDLEQFLKDKLFDVSNIRYKWKRDPDNHLYSGAGFSTNIQGLIKIAYFIKNDSELLNLLKKQSRFGTPPLIPTINSCFVYITESPSKNILICGNHNKFIIIDKDNILCILGNDDSNSALDAVFI